MSLLTNSLAGKQDEMEKRILDSSSWEEVQSILRENKIILSFENLIDLGNLLDADIEECDETIDKIPYVFVIKENKIQVRKSFGNWVTISRAVLEKIKSFA